MAAEPIAPKPSGREQPLAWFCGQDLELLWLLCPSCLRGRARGRARGSSVIPLSVDGGVSWTRLPLCVAQASSLVGGLGPKGKSAGREIETEGRGERERWVETVLPSMDLKLMQCHFYNIPLVKAVTKSI